MGQIQKTVALVVGIVFILVGILGFIPALVPNDLLLGIFAVNTLHSVVHLLVGIIGVVAAFTAWPRLYNQVIGIVYLLLGIVGFIPPLVTSSHPQNLLLGLVSINLSDNILHLVVGIAVTAIGFFVAEQKVQTASAS